MAKIPIHKYTNKTVRIETHSSEFGGTFFYNRTDNTTRMAVDNDDNEVNGNGATSNDDDYVIIYIVK